MSPGFSEEEARALNGINADGDDICALEGWYEDGVCDDFCPRTDGDCAGIVAVSCTDLRMLDGDSCKGDSGGPAVVE